MARFLEITKLQERNRSAQMEIGACRINTELDPKRAAAFELFFEIGPINDLLHTSIEEEIFTLFGWGILLGILLVFHMMD